MLEIEGQVIFMHTERLHTVQFTYNLLRESYGRLYIRLNSQGYGPPLNVI